ncbi:MAG: hypothetical protein KAU84_03285, partial [Thermoplasmatales archaeon]|nr:hypothetical protein [Thermoplasmatales archaeon]
LKLNYKKFNNEIGVEPLFHTSMAFVLMALSIALWGWGMGKNMDIYFYLGFVIWAIGFIVLLIGNFKK